jgi:anti-sigma regulatory factor (Ser/Thr protein kinase)
MKHKIIIPSTIDEIGNVYNWLELLLKDRVDMTLSQTILLVSQEITTNAVLHGNELSPHKFVTIEVNILPKAIIIDISDEGSGVKELPSKKEAEELDYLAENGRGLKLAVLMSDKIEVDGNSIKIIFNI